MTGCAAGIVILTMSITGVLLAFERQYIAWADEHYQVAPGPAGADVSIGAISKGLDLSTAAAPPSITIRNSATAPVQVSFGRERTIFIDPSDGKVLGEGANGVRAFLATVERIHRTRWGANCEAVRAVASPAFAM